MEARANPPGTWRPGKVGERTGRRGFRSMSKETTADVRARQGREMVNTSIGCQEESTKGEEYKGNSSITNSGLTCQMWSATRVRKK